MENKITKKPLNKFEKIWYPLCGAVALWGLVYTILGLIANNLPVPTEKNYLKQASNTIAKLFGLDFFGWGLIIFAIGMLSIVICLIVCAKGIDKEYEKSQRRAARLNRNRVNIEQPTEEVVNAEVK